MSIVGNNHIDFENQGAETYIEYKKIMLAMMTSSTLKMMMLKNHLCDMGCVGEVGGGLTRSLGDKARDS